MVVIAIVAVNASSGNTTTGLANVGVAGVAVQTMVGTGQWEFCLTVMIEYPALPSIRIVAGGAGEPEFAFVIIVAGMAF